MMCIKYILAVLIYFVLCSNVRFINNLDLILSTFELLEDKKLKTI
jgi:hypothetical protein